MALLTILEFPDPRLRTRAEPVRVFDAGLERLVRDMFETMYAAPGVGLAATQIDVHRRVLVMDVGLEEPGEDQSNKSKKKTKDPQVFINPELLEREGSEVSEEGCLSVPTIFEPVERATRVRVRAQDLRGQSFERELTGLAAICLQHEMDHLAGKLFVDYLSSLKRERIRRKLDKERRERAAGDTSERSAKAPKHAARVI
jgi:peptide deformylase